MKVNVFDSLPHDLSGEVFEILAENENVKTERIISKGHSSPDTGWYGQDKNEFVIVIKGNARISFEDGRSTSLNAGDYLNIKAYKKHRVSWTDQDTETIWLAIHY